MGKMPPGLAAYMASKGTAKPKKKAAANLQSAAQAKLKSKTSPLVPDTDFDGK